VPVKQGDHQPAAKQAADHVPVKQGDHQPAAKQVEGAKPGEHLELSKPADTQTHPSDQLLQKTKESFNDALKDGKM
ncbi:hypothetical protein ACP3V9_25365, partial [Salmonella enterica]|uniref:hypothetical protein n=1 Tax=Salmonella enterica TaxID=28901 RepID=UPI003CF82EBC